MQATIKRLILIDKLINQEKTGTPQELAARLKISKSHLFCILKELKECGAPILYDKKSKTYYYDKYFELHMLFKS
jgi:ribosomal protein S25